jgi:FRG domain
VALRDFDPTSEAMRMVLKFPEDQWAQISAADGLVTFRLKSWSSFYDFLEAEVFQSSASSKQNFIWRGQRRLDWTLSTSLDRVFAQLGLSAGSADLEARSRRHLEAFKYAARGRRGLNPADLLENDWWALGQHFGLATPLLDWTSSPFAAAYFAFEQLASGGTDHRAVYGLDRFAVSQRNDVLDQSESFERGRLPVLEFIDPMSDENPRLVSQGGLFTRTPIGVPVEQWVQKAFEGSSARVLLRIEIPDADRLTCLRALNRMNINHLSLFPDLSGASRSTNLKLEFESQ